MLQLLGANVVSYFLGRNKQAVSPVGTEGETGIAENRSGRNKKAATNRRVRTTANSTKQSFIYDGSL